MNEEDIIGFIRGVGSIVTAILEWLSTWPDFAWGFIVVSVVIAAPIITLLAKIADRLRS